jgi:hypothetical protein
MPESIKDIGALTGLRWQIATVGALSEANKVKLIPWMPLSRCFLKSTVAL